MLDREKHQNMLAQIFRDIYSSPRLASTLGFKGGTALYFFHRLNRFSVDLDFNLLNQDQTELVIEELQKILSKYGEIKKLANKRLSIEGILTYAAILQRINIDISKRIGNENYEIKQYNGISALVMVKEDLFASKLVATISRYKLAIRDLYDINFMFNQLWSYNPSIIQMKLEISAKELIKQIIEKIENTKFTNILADIGVLLDDSGKKYVKERLKSDLLNQLKSHLSYLNEKS